MHAPRDRDFRGNFLLADRHGRVGSHFDPRDYPANDQPHRQPSTIHTLSQQQQPQQQHHQQQHHQQHHHARDRGATPLSTASSSDFDGIALLPPRSKKHHRVTHGIGGSGSSTGGSSGIVAGKKKMSGCQLTAIWLSVIFLLFSGFLGLGLYLHGERHLHIPVFDTIGKYLLTESDAGSPAGSSASVCSHDNIVVGDVTRDPRLRKTTRRQITSQRPLPVCVTPSCIRASARVISAVNSSADPCHDFYAYACGGWRDKVTIPEGRDYVNAFYHVERDVERFFVDALSAPFSVNDPKHVTKVKTFFRSCMDEGAIEKLGMEPARQLIKKLGGMNLTGDWGKVAKEDEVNVLEAEAVAAAMAAGLSPTSPRVQKNAFRYENQRVNDPKVIWRRQFQEWRAASAADWTGNDGASACGGIGANAGPKAEEFRFHEGAGGEMRKWFAEEGDKLRFFAGDDDDDVDDPTIVKRSGDVGEEMPEDSNDRKPRSILNNEDVIVSSEEEPEDESDAELPQSRTKRAFYSSSYRFPNSDVASTQDPFVNLAGPRISAFFDDFRPLSSVLNPFSESRDDDNIDDAEASPLTEGSSPSAPAFDLTMVASNLILMGVFPLFDLRVIVDPRDSSRYAMQIRPWDPWKLPSLPPALLKGGKSNLEAIQLYNQYCDYYRDIFSIFAGQPVEREKACRYVDANRMRLLIQPSAKSLELSSLQDSADKTYWQRYTVSDLQTKFMPALDWVRLLSSFLPFSYFVSPDTRVYVSSPKYLMRANSFLHFWMREPDVLNDFLMTELLMEIIPLLPEEIQAARDRLFFGAGGNGSPLPPRPKRSMKCLIYSKFLFGEVLSSMYVKKRVKPGTKEAVVEMVDDIRDAFVDNLRQAHWMSRVSKAFAIDKALSMSHQVAYPPHLLNDSIVDRIARVVKVHPEKFFENMIDARVFTKVSQLSLLARKPNNLTWPHMPFDVNAYYSPTSNRFSIMAAILNDPYYAVGLPNYMNYGGIGKVIGHEIAHGFDNDGGRYDKHGNLQSWWTSNDVAFFRMKSQCFARQYSAMKVYIPEFDRSYNLDGNYTLTENIADRGGVKVAYAAYRRWVDAHGEEPRLPGLVFTPDQLFFLSTAQISCSVHHPWSLLERIANGKHTPDHQRVNGFLINSPEFAEAFQCPLRSEMNPMEKCDMW